MDKATQALMFSSKTGEHGTPPELFNWLNKEFGFDIDVAANYTNAKCKKFFGLHKLRGTASGTFIDGLQNPWGKAGENNTAYCNPPYGKAITHWLEKAIYEAKVNEVLSVFLLPARTDTKWFHELVLPHSQEVRFVRGRIKFSGEEAGAPFPSLIVVFAPATINWTSTTYIELDKHARWTSVWLTK